MQMIQSFLKKKIVKQTGESYNLVKSKWWNDQKIGYYCKMRKKCNELSIKNKLDQAKFKMATTETEVEIENPSCEKDIRVHIVSKFNFDSRTHAVVKKAISKMGVIRRAILSLGKAIFLLLFKAIVRFGIF